MGPRIAISYRRSDSQDITGRIFDRLRQHFGKDAVFRDIDNIRPGIDFRVQISEALRTTDVLLVIMGPKWFGRAKGEGARINNDADPVRIEVETALQRDIPVIPVLVGNMRMPTTVQLPDSLKDLAYRHGVTVDGGRDFDYHLAGLIRALEVILESKLEVANTKPASDEQGIPPKPAFDSLTPDTTDAVETSAVPADLREKVPSEENSSHSRSASFVDLAGEPSEKEALKPDQPGAPALLRLIWPKRSNRGFLLVGLIISFSVGVGGLALSTYLAKTSRSVGQLEDVRKPAEAGVAKDENKSAEAQIKSPSTPATTLPTVTASNQTSPSAAPDARPVTAGGHGDRIALVIGNANYHDAPAPLLGLINDARDIANELLRDGFNVDVEENLTGDGMRRAFDKLYGYVKPGNVVLVFYSGFGIQSNRQNYLIPVDAQIWTEPDVRREGLSLEMVLGEINRRGAGVKIALVDASRRNPFERRFRSFSAGLAPVIAPNDTLVMYSTALSSVISDNGNDHSLFVQELVKQIRVPDLTAEETFNRTRLGVARASLNEQVPWISSSLAQDFSFISPRNALAR